MSNLRRQLNDGESGTGSVSTVIRDGATVRRPTGPWTPAVHALLNHLAVKDFDYAPRVLGLEQDFEIVDYMAGDVGLRPWPPCLTADSAIIAIAGAINAYHQAVSDFIPPPGSIWRCPDLRWAPGMIVRHGDLGPWNMVWRDEQLVGIIDWDMAEPGFPIEDIAQIAWQCVPLRPPHICLGSGIQSGSVQDRRLALLCEIGDVSRNDVMDALRKIQMTEVERILHLGASGVEPWTSFHSRGDVTSIEADMLWLNEYSRTL